MLADNMEDNRDQDEPIHLVRFLAISLGAIRARLQAGIDKAIQADRADRLKVVDNGGEAS